MLLKIMGLLGILLAIVNVFITVIEGNPFFLIFVLLGAAIGLRVYGPKGSIWNKSG